MQRRAPARAADDPRGDLSVQDRYLDLLKRSLTRANVPPEVTREIRPHHRLSRAGYRMLKPFLDRRRIRMVRQHRFDPMHVELGFAAHPDSETMIGLRRMDNLQESCLTALREAIPGDFVEAGVWRGGAAIFMRGILAAYADPSRLVWAADSFEGLPTPDVERFPADDQPWMWEQGTWLDDLAVSLDEVKANFARYGLLDERVRFLPGWFKDTLLGAPIERISVLRLDGDLYESTIQTLDALYPKVSDGGFIIIDDYGAWEPCHQATDDYRKAHGIEDEIRWIDWTGAYWRKGGAGPASDG